MISKNQIFFAVQTALPLVCVFLFLGCVPRQEKAVIVYCAADREFAEPIFKAYERANQGTEVVPQFDVESSKTLGLVTRIEQEKSRPRCDVFWNNEILHTIRLQKAGLLVSKRWPIPDNWPKNFRASDGTWIGYAARARVLLINRDKLKDKSLWPTSVMELADEKWSKQCGMAYPIYGTTSTHMAVLASLSKWQSGDVKSFDEWIDRVKKNAVVLAGNKQVAIAVGSGELAWGLTDTDDAMIEKENGKPVAVIFPDQGSDQMGTVFIPNSVSILKKSPNPVAAEALANYLISEKIEGRLVMGSSAHFPIWPSSKEEARFDEGKNARKADIDFEKAAEKWQEVQDRLQSVFGNPN